MLDQQRTLLLQLIIFIFVWKWSEIIFGNIKIRWFELVAYNYLETKMNSRARQEEDIINFQTSKSLMFEDKPLRNITADDRFPCYGCFDKLKEKISCKICDRRGFIYGNHPMVKFVDDFLNKNLQPHLKNNSSQFKENCINDNSQSSDDEKYERRGNVSNRK